MKTKTLLTLFALIFTVVLVSNSVQDTFAAKPAGTHIWYVKDTRGNPIGGAEVTLSGSGYSQTSYSISGSGKVVFTGVPEGTFNLNACYGSTSRTFNGIQLPSPGTGGDEIVLQNGACTPTED